MKIKFEKQLLKGVLDRMAKIAAAAPDAGVSHEMKIASKDGAVYLHAINSLGSQGVVYKFESSQVEVEVEGGCCVPCLPLRETVGLLMGDNITLSAENGAVTIEGDGAKDSEVVLAGMLPETWATIPLVTRGPAKFSIARETLFEIGRVAAFSCNPDRTQAPQTAILVEIGDNGDLRCTSTDLHRVTYYQMPQSVKIIDVGKFENGIRFMLPCDVANSLSSIIGSDVAEVDVAVDAAKMMFAADNVRYTCSQEVGVDRYPKMRELLVDKEVYSVLVDVEEIRRVAKLVNVVANKNICVVEIDAKAGTILISGTGKINKASRSQQTIPVSDIQGTPFAKGNLLSVSSEDLNEALRIPSGKEIRIGLTNTANESVNPILTICDGDSWKHQIFRSTEV